MKCSRLALAVVFAPSFALATSSADFDEQLKLPALVVSANRTAEERDAASSAVTVFTRADIDRLQPRSVLELLARAPGVQITQSGGAGSMSGLFIRGTKTAQSVVLVDGQRISGADAGIAQLEVLSLEQIERVEVLRGSRSALYGSDAIGGVVQIFTRRAEGPGLQARVHAGYGTHSTVERSAGLSGGDADTRFSLNLSANDTDGINRTTVSSSADNDRDAYRNNAASLNLSHRFNERLSAGVSVLDQRGESEYDRGWQGSYPYTDFQLSSQSAYVEGWLNDAWSSRVEVGHSENRAVTRHDDNATASPFNTYRNSLAWLNTLHLGGGHSLTAGLEGSKEYLNSKTAYVESSRWNHAALLQHRFQADAFATEVGVRHDDNEQFGSENTFNGAFTYHLNSRNDVILSYAEGFRAPTFTDLYWPADPIWGGGGNANLQPEHAKTYELQWRSQLAERTRLSASLYRTDLNDAIGLNSSWAPSNIDTARINGVEAALQHELFGWNTALALGFVDPRDRDSGHTLNRRAKRTLSLDVDRAFGAFSVGAGWTTSSRRFDDAVNTRETAGYGLLNLRAGWQVSSDVKLGLQVENLLDKEYSNALYGVSDPVTWVTTYHPYQETGRTALASVTWTPTL